MDAAPRRFAERRFAERCFARPLLLAPLLGAVAACGFEPLHLWPLTLLAIAGLIELLVRAASWQRAVLIGWLWGVAHFSLGNNWIAAAFTYQAAMPAWLGWLGVFGLSLYLAVFPALAMLAAWQLGRKHGASLILAFAGFWIISEWLRSWIFTGFAWNPLGVVALGPFDRPGLALVATGIGTYGLSGLVVLLAGSWHFAVRRAGADWLARADRRAGGYWRGLAMLALPIALLTLFPTGSSGALISKTPFTLIQPNIDQKVLNDPANFETQFVKSAQLTRTANPDQQRLVLWPESGMPYYLRDGYPPEYYADRSYLGDPGLSRLRIGRVIGEGSLLLTGTVDLEIRGGQAVGARNSVTALDGRGNIRGSYVKAHLVPYGEYLPMRALLTPLGLSRLVPGDIDFLPGPGPRTLDLGAFGKTRIKAGVQVCYEIVFSGEVVDRAHRPDFIFNPSNDGWFGSWGPPQHLAQARLRAIEEGLPVLRATTNGVSAVVLANGVVNQFIPHRTIGRIDGMLPGALPPTLFARAGNKLPLGLAAIFLGTALLVLRRARG